MAWISQNWFFLLFLFALVFFGWFAWPRMQPNPRRIVAGGMGLASLAIFLARLAGGAAYDPRSLARAAVMGLAGLFLLLAAYLPGLQEGRLEMAGWGMLLGSAGERLGRPGTGLRNTMIKLIDLSHTIESGMQTYPGLPGPVISDHLSREDSRSHYTQGTEFYIGKIEMVANTGTYLDSPFHRYADGIDLSGLELDSLADLEGVVVRARGRQGRAISQEAFQGIDLYRKAVLVHTGWDAYWRTEAYFTRHPFLTESAARFLVEAGAALVGIDSLNIDDTGGGERPAHSLLLGAGIPIVEHLCGLEQLPERGFRFFAVPVKVKGLGSFPVRAFAIV